MTPLLKHTLSAFLMVSLVASVGCKSEVDNKPAAKVEPAAPATDAKKPAADEKKPAADEKKPAADEKKPAAATAATLKVDPAKSKIGFVGAKVTGDHKGGFKDFEGTITVEGANVTGMTYTVKMDSTFSDDEKLTGHLKSPDFFEVAKHPTSKFESTEIKAVTGKDGQTHEISGNLTLRGTTKKITFPAKVELKPEMAMGTTEFTINRKDFGIVYPGKPDNLIKDDVLLKIELVAPRK